MVKILSKIFAVFFVLAKSDLIGYNRLGNNIGHHVRYRAETKLDTNQYQILQWMMANKTLTSKNKQELFKTLTTNSQRRPNRRSNRRTAYQNHFKKSF